MIPVAGGTVLEHIISTGTVETVDGETIQPRSNMPRIEGDSLCAEDVALPNGDVLGARQWDAHVTF